MSNKEITELQRLEVLRLSNEESNQLTKTCIESALVLLMKDNRFEDISITSIVKRAGVSRTAYYRNYKSKEDILRSMMKEILNKMINGMNLKSPIVNSHEYWHSLFKIIGQHRDSLFVLLQANFGDAVLNEIRNIRLCSTAGGSTLDDYKSVFWSGAIYHIVSTWIRGGSKQTVEEMAAICYRIIDDLN